MIGNRISAMALAAASATFFSTPSAIASPFDGNWIVVAQTTQGHCGSIQFGLPAQLFGRVSPSGDVRANGVAGPRTALVIGRLGRFQGSGTWAGSGPSGVCSGIWIAAPLRQTF
jgi:hypothetical protein